MIPITNTRPSARHAIEITNKLFVVFVIKKNFVVLDFLEHDKCFTGGLHRFCQTDNIFWLQSAGGPARSKTCRIPCALSCAREPPSGAFRKREVAPAWKIACDLNDTIALSSSPEPHSVPSVSEELSRSNKPPANQPARR